MPDPNNDKPVCYLSMPFSLEFKNARKAVVDAVKSANFGIMSVNDPPRTGPLNRERLMGQLSQADSVIIDISEHDPNVFFELGIAQAMGKTVFPIVRQDMVDRNSRYLDVRFLTYENTSQGYKQLTQDLLYALKEFKRSPQRAQLMLGGKVSTPFFIDWDKLDPTDGENLCQELLRQMGLSRVDWYKKSKEFDLIAEYPRKDPDGYEYKELWLISMGRNAPPEMVMDILSHEPEYFVRKIMRDDERILRDRFNSETVNITVLFIMLRGRESDDLEIVRRRVSERISRRGMLPTLRVRVWDRDYLTSLVQQFPNIGYKYFSDEARSLSKYRKGPDELYHENVALTERLTKTLADLEEEKNGRIRAERDSVWKDISFAAAHKIGNPIFAIETDLGPLQKRIFENRKADALDVISNVRAAVEKAKNIVEQFKSLTKAQQVTAVPTLLQPILADCCRILEAQNVKCAVDCAKDILIFGDTDRLSEVFDELATNALRWFDKAEKKVTINVTTADRTSLPSAVDSKQKYILINFRDNGTGVSLEDKPRIFDAFFSRYDQGTGLGLALVRRIIEGHGGIIRETGIPGQGANFEIYLRLAEEATK